MDTLTVDGPQDKASLTNCYMTNSGGIYTTPYIAGGKASTSRNCPAKLDSKILPSL